MAKKKIYDLTELPQEVRDVFNHSRLQLQEAGNLVSLVEFSFVALGLLINVDFEDSQKNEDAARARQLINDVFSEDEGFLDRKYEQLEKAYEEINLQRLYSQSVVYFWTNLESFINRLLAFLVGFDQELMSSDEFKKIKIPMADFYKLKKGEQNKYLAGLITTNLRCEKKYGSHRFDCFLASLGLAGKTNNDIAKNLVEVHQLRNCIVHSDSIADSHLVTTCPWLKYEIGDKIHISTERISSYETSILAYHGEVWYRLNKTLGAPKHVLDSIKDTNKNLFENELE